MLQTTQPSERKPEKVLIWWNGPLGLSMPRLLMTRAEACKHLKKLRITHYVGKGKQCGTADAIGKV